MEITEVTIFTVNTRKPPRAFTPVVVRIQTDEAISGIGEVGLAYGVGAIAGANMVAELTEGFLLGENPLDVERIWDSMFRRSFWGQGGGPIVMGAISAIDIALWDIKGKAAGLPIYAMLGGPCRDRLRMYANGWYDGLRSSEEYAEKALSVVADGYGALKLDPFMFSAEGDLDMPGQILDPARATLGYERVRAMRKAVGPDVDILIDAHGNMGVASAIIVGKRLEELNPFFYEEPVATMNVDTMKKVAEKVSIPLAGGERLYTRFGFRPFIEEQAMEILQPDVGLAGGITEVKKIAAGAETYDILMQPHNCSSPLMTAACVQLDACITNFVIQEVFPYREEDLLHVVREPLESRTAAGVIDIPATPGLGIELNEEYIKPYLYKTLV